MVLGSLTVPPFDAKASQGQPGPARTPVITPISIPKQAHSGLGAKDRGKIESLIERLKDAPTRSSSTATTNKQDQTTVSECSSQDLLGSIIIRQLEASPLGSAECPSTLSNAEQRCEDDGDRNSVASLERAAGECLGLVEGPVLIPRPEHAETSTEHIDFLGFTQLLDPSKAEAEDHKADAAGPGAAPNVGQESEGGTGAFRVDSPRQQFGEVPGQGPWIRSSPAAGTGAASTAGSTTTTASSPRGGRVGAPFDRPRKSVRNRLTGAMPRSPRSTNSASSSVGAKSNTAKTATQATARAVGRSSRSPQDASNTPRSGTASLTASAVASVTTAASMAAGTSKGAQHVSAGNTAPSPRSRTREVAGGREAAGRHGGQPRQPQRHSLSGGGWGSRAAAAATATAAAAVAAAAAAADAAAADLGAKASNDDASPRMPMAARRPMGGRRSGNRGSLSSPCLSGMDKDLSIEEQTSGISNDVSVHDSIDCGTPLEAAEQPASWPTTLEGIESQLRKQREDIRQRRHERGDEFREAQVACKNVMAKLELAKRAVAMQRTSTTPLLIATAAGPAPAGIEEGPESAPAEARADHSLEPPSVRVPTANGTPRTPRRSFPAKVDCGPRAPLGQRAGLGPTMSQLPLSARSSRAPASPRTPPGYPNVAATSVPTSATASRNVLSRGSGSGGGNSRRAVEAQRGTLPPPRPKPFNVNSARAAAMRSHSPPDGTLTRVAEEYHPRGAAAHQEALANALCIMEDSVRSLFTHGPIVERNQQAAGLAYSAGNCESSPNVLRSPVASAESLLPPGSLMHERQRTLNRMSSQDSCWSSEGGMSNGSKSAAPDCHGHSDGRPSRWLSAVLVEPQDKDRAKRGSEGTASNSSDEVRQGSYTQLLEADLATAPHLLMRPH